MIMSEAIQSWMRETQQDLKNYEQLQYELLFGKNVENRAFFDAAVE